MYKIRNNSAGKVIIGDLNLVLNHGEEKDLETLFSRDTISASNNLRRAMQGDKKRPPVIVLINDSTSIITPPPILEPLVDQDALDAMEKRIRQQINDQVQELIKKQDKKPITTDDLAEKMDLILKALTSGQLAPSQISSGSPASHETENFVDDDKEIDIHKRTIERLSRYSKASISSEKSESKDTGVDTKANELEGLI